MPSVFSLVEKWAPSRDHTTTCRAPGATSSKHVLHSMCGTLRDYSLLPTCNHIDILDKSKSLVITLYSNILIPHSSYKNKRFHIWYPKLNPYLLTCLRVYGGDGVELSISAPGDARTSVIHWPSRFHFLQISSFHLHMSRYKKSRLIRNLLIRNFPL